MAYGLKACSCHPLSVVDLLTSFFMIWFAVGALGKGGWPIPQANWICEATAFMLYTGIGTSLWTLGAIALNRLIRITKPFSYKKIFTSWKLCLFVGIPWIIPGSGIIIFLVSEHGAVGYSHEQLVCADLDEHPKADIFNLSQILVGFPVPLVAIIVSYTWIYVHVKKHFTVQKKNFPGAKTRNDNNGVKYEIGKSEESSDVEKKCVEDDHKPRLSDSSRKKLLKQQADEIQITKNLFLVVCAFFACFLPYLLLHLLATVNLIDQRIGGHIRFYFKLGPIANSATNFVIYARRHPRFKTVLCHMVTCSYGDIKEPTKFLKFLLMRES